MKTRYLSIVLLSFCFLSFAQKSPKKKKLQFSFAVMGQKVTENPSEGEIPYFNSKSINYDVQFKIGRIFYKEKITAGLALNFSSINFHDWESARQDIEENRNDYYKSTTEMQFGLFVRYKIYDEIFIDAYIGLFGVFQDGGFFPRVDDSHDIIKYNFSIGYGIHLWHFVAVEPHIGIRNPRAIYKGTGNISDDISPLSFGLGLTFKL